MAERYELVAGISVRVEASIDASTRGFLAHHTSHYLTCTNQFIVLTQSRRRRSTGRQYNFRAGARGWIQWIPLKASQSAPSGCKRVPVQTCTSHPPWHMARNRFGNRGTGLYVPVGADIIFDIEVFGRVDPNGPGWFMDEDVGLPRQREEL